MSGWVEMTGYVAAFLVLTTFYMKTAVPLRCAAITSNFAFITYGYFGHFHPVLVLHLILLPLNTVRLVQMLRLVKDVQRQSVTDLSFGPMAPYMTRVRFRAGEVLFRRGDPADRLFILQSGSILLPEIGVVLSDVGAVLGEIGIFSPTRQRTTSAVVQADTEALALAADKVLQLYFQNPKFGVALLHLMMARLLRDRDAAAMPASVGASPAPAEGSTPEAVLADSGRGRLAPAS